MDDGEYTEATGVSISWITRSLQVKLIGMLAILPALLGVRVALNFNTFSSLDGSVPALNQSGAQRMRLFKLATEASTIERFTELYLLNARYAQHFHGRVMLEDAAVVK